MAVTRQPPRSKVQQAIEDVLIVFSIAMRGAGRAFGAPKAKPRGRSAPKAVQPSRRWHRGSNFLDPHSAIDSHPPDPRGTLTGVHKLAASYKR